MKGKNVMVETKYEYKEDGALYNIKTLMTDIKQKNIQIDEYLKKISELKGENLKMKNDLQVFERQVVEEQKARYQSYDRVGHLIKNQSVFIRPCLNWIKRYKFW